MTYQMGDSLGGLIFILTILLELFISGRVIYLWLKGRNFTKIVLAFFMVAILYIIALLVASILSSDRNIPFGSTECFDDWCASVLSATSSKNTIVFNVRVTNNARRSAQSPDHPRLFLLDTNGNTYFSAPTNADDIGKRLDAGESFDTQVSFSLDENVSPSRVLLTEGSGPPLIGDQNSWLHKKTYFELPRQ